MISRLFMPLRIILMGLLLTFTFIAKAQFKVIYYFGDVDGMDVKDLHFFSDKEGYAALGERISYTDDSSRTFIHKYITRTNVNYNGYPANITFGFGINGVHAFNKNELLVFGDYGGVPAILHSSDGAKSFKLVHHTTLNLNNIDGITGIVFTSRQIGYATEQDRIVKTIDGGLTWTECLSSPNSFFTGIQAVTNEVLYATADYNASKKLWRSVDGGVSWTALNTPWHQVNHAFFLTRDKGWANILYPGSENYTTIYTSDGGNSWKNITGHKINSFLATKLKFLNDSTGYAITSAGKLYKTTDSGRVWEPLLLTLSSPDKKWSEKLLCFEMRGENLIWIGGNRNGDIAISKNGGGIPNPVSKFLIDTSGLILTGLTKLTSYSRPHYQHQWFVNGKRVGTSVSLTYTHDHKIRKDTIKLIVDNGTYSDSSIQYQDFPEQYIPEIESFYPAIAEEGSVVYLNGSGLNYVTGVRFGGVAAASFKVLSKNLIMAVVGKGNSGNITISTSFMSVDRSGFTFRVVTSQAPVISNMSTDHGNIGSSITITGQHFNPDLALNHVTFGTIKANVTSASATHLNFSVPAGAVFSPITILNKGTGLATTAPRHFKVTFPDSTGFAEESFKKAFVDETRSFGSVYSNLSADIDGDGKTDIVQYISSPVFQLRFFRNTGKDGKVGFTLIEGPQLSKSFGRSILIRDLDNDGKPDILQEADDSKLEFLRNVSTPGNISFEPLRQINVEGAYDYLTINDLDGDGRVDLVYSYWSKKSIYILRNTSTPGNLSFTAPQSFSYPTHIGSLDIVDIDGDGRNELLAYTINLSTNKVQFQAWLNRSSPGNIMLEDKGTFDFVKNYPSIPVHRLIDYDGDGKTDLIHFNQNDLHLFRNTSSTGGINFAEPVILNDYLVGTQYNLLVSNFSGRVNADLIIEQNGSQWARFLGIYNESQPGLIKQYSFSVPFEDDYWAVPIHFDCADFNEDGKPDIVYSSAYNGQITNVLINTTGVPVITRICSDRKDSITTNTTGTSFQWQVNKGAGFVNLTDDEFISNSKTSKVILQNLPDSWNNYKIRCITDGRAGIIHQLHVAGKLQPEISFVPGAANFCEGEMTKVKAQFSNAGKYPVFYWYLNSELQFYTSDSVYSSNKLKHGDKIHYRIVSDEKCGDRVEGTVLPLTMQKKGDFTAVSIEPLSDVICTDSLVTYRAKVTNGGTNPAFRWFNNLTEISDQPEVKVKWSSLYNSLNVEMTSNAATCNTGPVTATANYTLTRSFKSEVLLKFSTTAICEGTPVIFTAQPMSQHAGETPRLEWYLDGGLIQHSDRVYKAQLPPGSKMQVKIISTRRCTVPAFSEIITLTKGEGPIIAPTPDIVGKKLIEVPGFVDLSVDIKNPGIIKTIWWEDSLYGKWETVPGSTGLHNLSYYASPPVKLRIAMWSHVSCVGDTLVKGKVHEINTGTVTSTSPDPVAVLGIRHFPNPVTKELVIEGLNLADKWESMVIMDQAGRKQLELPVNNQRKLTIQLSRLPPGLYVAVLQRKSGKAGYIKFIKQ